jgi:uncharacterized protein
MANIEKNQRDSENQNDQRNQGNTENEKKRTGTSNRGFASMDEKRHREISAMGGRASHESGRGHEFDSEEARIAGRKGGQASHGGGRKSAASRPDENTNTRGSMSNEEPDNR